jgi:hypothetical protein
MYVGAKFYPKPKPRAETSPPQFLFFSVFAGWNIVKIPIYTREWRYLPQSRINAKTTLKHHNRKISESTFEEVTEL